MSKQVLDTDICGGCGKSFVYGLEGSARMSIKRHDDLVNEYYYAHVMVCPECVEKVVKNG